MRVRRSLVRHGGRSVVASNSVRRRVGCFSLQEILLQCAVSTAGEYEGQEKGAHRRAHSLIVVGYHLLKRGCSFQDLGPDYFERVNHTALTRYHVKKLNALGYDINITLKGSA